MAFNYINQIPAPEEIKALIPLPEPLRVLKENRDREIAQVFRGESDKFILIIGPCSAHDEDAVVEYVKRLAKLQEQVKEKIILVPRVYTNKPRTTGEGYKGMLHQPVPMDEPNILKGIKAIRNMHIRIMETSGLTSADEMLYPMNYPYLDDVLSYVAVGARSVENQQHRLAVSGMEVPAGMKNPTGGDLGVMLNSIKAAQISHRFIYNGYEVQTSGNIYSHGILRGAVNQYGRNIPNYHYEDLMFLKKKYAQRGLYNQAIIIDASHANSMKQYDEQPRICMEVMRSRKHDQGIRQMVKGLMIESYLEEGKQDECGLVFGKSITDACLGWTASEELVLEIARHV
ncbi:3-deoxy-7-phosphoheptulonate synthase [Fusibacter sp. JL216-2]|uniref:3-deoxy-7-phosphoheptulonate synthase n=1 Tax=Fusibacter sp. JL216-2 TaxID=3071453 RepID=UPI003D337052